VVDRIGLANVNTARRTPGHKTPALIYRVDYSKGEYEGFGFTGLHGKAANFAADGTWMRDTGAVDADGNPILEETGFDGAGKDTQMHLLEFDAYFVRGDWSLFGQVSYGQQKGSAIYNSDGQLRDARWWGLSATGGLQGHAATGKRAARRLRGQQAQRRRPAGLQLRRQHQRHRPRCAGDGSFAKGEGTGSNRWALSLGMNYLYDENTIFKLEFRHDGANQPVFANQKGLDVTGYRKSNQLLGASVVVKF
jgi:hypothetical protein